MPEKPRFALIGVLLCLMTFSASTRANSTEVSALSVIPRLHELYQVFRIPEKRAALSLAERRQVEAEFLELLDQVPLSILQPQMEKYEVVFEDQFEAIKDKRSFVQRLAKRAMNGIISPPAKQTPDYGRVTFSDHLNQPDSAIFSER